MASTASTENQPDKFLPNIRIHPETYDALRALAKANYRTVAAEVRLAIDNHLKGAST